MADSSEIRQLLLQISANTELLRSNLSEAEKAVKKFHEDTQGHLDQIDKRWAGLGKSIEQLHRPLERLKSLSELAVGALLGESLLRKGKEALEFAGNIQFMANQIGVSTGFLQKFNYAAGQFGVSNEVAGTALTRFTRTIGEAANGNKQAIDLFDRLGVKIRDQNGNVRAAEAIYQDFANGLKKVDSPAQRVADTMQAMGRQAASLTPLVAQGADGFNDLARAAEQLGIVLSPELIEHSEEVNHKLAAMKQIIDAQMASVIATNAVAIESLADALIKAAAATAKFLNSHPREAAAGLGVLAGSRVGGLPGAIVGGGAGLLLHDKLEEDAKDQNPDPAFRLQQYRAARTQYLQAKRQQANATSGKLPYFLMPTHDEMAGIAAEVHKQADLLRQADSRHRASAGQGSTGAGATNNNGDDLKKAQGELGDLTKAKVGATGAALAAINDEIAQQKRYVGFLKKGLTAEEAKSLASKEGTELTKGETAVRRAAKKAEEDRRKALEDDAAYHQQELRLQKSILDGARKTAANDSIRDNLQKQIINEEADTLAAQIKDRAARGGYALDSKENAARAKHLLQLNDQNRAQGVINVDLSRASQDLDDQLRALTLSVDGTQTLLSLDEQLATTRKQRLDIELRLLDLSEKAAKAEQQRILDDKSGKYSDGDRASAKTRISQIDQQHAGNVAVIKDRNADPLAAFKRQLHQNTDDMNDALKGVAADGLQSLEDGLAGLLDGTQSAAQAFKHMADRIIADLARIAIEKAIVAAIDAAAGSSNGTLSSIGKFFGGGKASGGAVDGSKFYLVGENGPELFIPNGGGSIVPNGGARAPNISSRDMRAANNNGGPNITVHVDARGAQSPEQVRQIAQDAVLDAAPAIIAASHGRTLNVLSRPTLPRSQG
jgi:hypothetical protein